MYLTIRDALIWTCVLGLIARFCRRYWAYRKVETVQPTVEAAPSKIFWRAPAVIFWRAAPFGGCFRSGRSDRKNSGTTPMVAGSHRHGCPQCGLVMVVCMNYALGLFAMGQLRAHGS